MTRLFGSELNLEEVVRFDFSNVDTFTNMWSKLDSNIAIHMHLIDYRGSFPTRVQLGEIEDAFQHLLADLVIIVVALGVDSLIDFTMT
jgi:hypothetical protein